MTTFRRNGIEYRKLSIDVPEDLYQLMTLTWGRYGKSKHIVDILTAVLTEEDRYQEDLSQLKKRHSAIEEKRTELIDMRIEEQARQLSQLSAIKKAVAYQTELHTDGTDATAEAEQYRYQRESAVNDAVFDYLDNHPGTGVFLTGDQSDNEEIRDRIADAVTERAGYDVSIHEIEQIYNRARDMGIDLDKPVEESA